MLWTQKYVQLCSKAVYTKRTAEKAWHEEVTGALWKMEWSIGPYKENPEITSMESEEMAPKAMGWVAEVHEVAKPSRKCLCVGKQRSCGYIKAPHLKETTHLSRNRKGTSELHTMEGYSCSFITQYQQEISANSW